MVRVNELTPETRAEIVALHNEGMPVKDIVSKFGISKSCVYFTIKKFKNENSFVTNKRCGRPPALTKEDEQFIKVCSLRDRRRTVRELCEVLNVSRKKRVGLTTVRNAFKKCGLVGRVACRKPLLRPNNIKKRLALTRKHVHWTLEDWKKVLFTDESKFELFGSNRRIYVRRRKHERYLAACLVPTVKHGGGSIMVWGAISLQGVGPLKKITGIMDKKCKLLFI